jgi:hypothetical protein
MSGAVTWGPKDTPSIRGLTRPDWRYRSGWDFGRCAACPTRTVPEIVAARADQPFVIARFSSFL